MYNPGLTTKEMFRYRAVGRTLINIDAVFISFFFMGASSLSSADHYSPLPFQEIQEGILHECQIPKGAQRGDFR